ncbi:MAG: MarR family transcriptional regulator [Alphaproteobacteria bacterium]|nr:MarR family transcriptional regulator [Alphaproteobacteria bacterium]
MSTPEHLRLDRQLCLSVYSAANALVRAYGPLLRPLGLTYPQYLVMLALWERDEAPVTDLCARTRLDTGTVTPLVNRLAAKGLVRKTHARDDARVRLVTLTTKGRALRARAAHVPIQMACLGVLSAEQGAHMKALSDTLYQGLVMHERLAGEG